MFLSEYMKAFTIVLPDNVLILVLLDVPIGVKTEQERKYEKGEGLNPCFTGCSYRS